MKFYLCQRVILKNHPPKPSFFSHWFNLKKRFELYTKYYAISAIDCEIEYVIANELESHKHEITKNISSRFKIVEIECDEEMIINNEVYVITKKYYVEYFEKDDELKHINYYGIRVMKTVIQ